MRLRRAIPGLDTSSGGVGGAFTKSNLEVSMHNKAFSCAARALVVVFAVGISALAQNQHTDHFSGIINDFTPAHDAKGKPSGPWELHGAWRLNLKRDSGTAEFSAALTMENSDYWLLSNPNPPADPDAPATRTPHNAGSELQARQDRQVGWDCSKASSRNFPWSRRPKTPPCRNLSSSSNAMRRGVPRGRSACLWHRVQE